MSNPIEVHRELKNQILGYYDTPFGLAESKLTLERRALLDIEGGIHREPLFELRPNYVVSGKTLGESAGNAGLTKEEAEFFSCGLIPEGVALYSHQERALEKSSGSGNLVLTPGTGSGKTESFLLPMIAEMLRESRNWKESDLTESKWWKDSKKRFEPSRKVTGSRRAAVRSLILYPMNALVDDQLVRLRKALDSPKATDWLDRNRDGSRFYFGRYTGATPVLGEQNNSARVTELRGILDDASRLVDSVHGESDERFFIQKPYSAEMISRWDMLSCPPDILITNYSMLNIMLRRAEEKRLFDSTIDWLNEDDSHVFTLVLDEMHSYRGTAGTEVAYIVRSLISRLGLYSKPRQLRVVAASASLSKDRDEAFLSDFFGLPVDSFEFIEGDVEIRPVKSGSDANVPSSLQALEELAPEVLGPLIENAFVDSSTLIPLRAEDLGVALLPTANSDEAAAAGERVIARISEDESGLLPKLRGHLFFKNVPGMWACCNVECSAVEEEFRFEGRRIGKLQAKPAIACECGSRVLELLYCQSCGETLLGGFATPRTGKVSEVDFTLLPDMPDLRNVPDNVGTERTASNYRVYWPKPMVPVSNAERGSKKNGVDYRFRPVNLHSGVGRLTGIGRNSSPDGWIFDISTSQKSLSLDDVLPFPTACPHCDDDWRIFATPERTLPPLDRLTMRSPIRTMRTGFEKVNQVLISSLMRSLPAAKRKSVVFTDSRQDAAKLSSGIELNHHQDLVRALLNRRVEAGILDEDLVSDAREYFRTFDTKLMARQVEFMQKWTAHGAEIARLWTQNQDEAAESLILAGSRSATLQEISDSIASDLLILGINPAGPKADVQYEEISSGNRSDTAKYHWSELFDWSSPDIVTARLDLPRVLGDFKNRLYTCNEQAVIESVSSGSGRDFESIGLGWIDTARNPTDPKDRTRIHEIAQASTRILAQKRRFIFQRSGTTKAPLVLRKYWDAVAKNAGSSSEQIEEQVVEIWSDSVKEFLLDPAKILVHSAPPQVYKCNVCTRQHVSYGYGVCTNCLGELSEDLSANKRGEDYYAANAAHESGVFKLRCAELTGQTGARESQRRQASFQNIFLGEGQNPRVDSLEVLSVTTTMEAGVDIGSLDVVVMGNMPPTRFNYQQRVGRAGRRSASMAMALTVCRPRSHDEHYFDNPDLIVSDPTPAPYLALDSEKIASRVITAEVLRLAFNSVEVVDLIVSMELDPTRNPHGRYGTSADWSILQPVVKEWIARNRQTILEDISSMFRLTPFQNELSELLDSAIVEFEKTAAVITDPDFVGHSDFSQRLAENGLLPMFGFPTRSRQLFIGKPKKGSPWPPESSIERDAPMALSAFAPGSELIKDGWIYKSVGVAAWAPGSFRATEIEDPFADQGVVFVCRRCSHLGILQKMPEHDLQCPECGADPGVANAMQLREPLGFFASNAVKDKRAFDGNFAWTPRAMHARALADLEKLDHQDLPTFSVYSGSASKFIINDKKGHQFNFEQRYPGENIFVDNGSFEDESTESVALGMRQKSDFGFFGARRSTFLLGGDSWSLHLSTAAEQIDGSNVLAEGKRAAWYSLAFLLRKVASTFLDVEPLDLDAGILSTHVDGAPATFAFITDTVENGAGFSTHVAAPDVFDDYLIKIEEYVEEHLESADHEATCNGSCYGCLRDYQNMRFHPLLDWKLAVDLFKLIRKKKIGDYLTDVRRVAEVWASSYGGRVEIIEGSPCIKVKASRSAPPVYLVPYHSLEDTSLDSGNARLKRVYEALFSRGDRVFLVDAFTMERTPSLVLADIRE
ncbi:DEAD/DEAH box helicase [Glutamicibacter mysorens]|uniref:DEAD/DEAH box helicase n=1 Tax=Glutamicibacter mysorens TaxID=257984 RepID=UPI0020C63388|nr:DEAD/DEAH box helicase [Glutamicibacter mysorens]UTM45923.1 DEAD/DEAH box helicase [Glutamicibacter mysorens]